MSGTDLNSGAHEAPPEQRLLSLFNREIEFNPLSALISAIRSEPTNIPLSSTAIGIDANVFLRISSNKKGADITDYLASAHEAPIILPGQAVQEFWNSRLGAVPTIAIALGKQIEALGTEISKLNDNFGEYHTQFKDLLQQFTTDHGNVYDENTVRSTLTLLEALERKALVPHAPRQPFIQIAAMRKRTKTPPGFKDDGDGDFFVWVDYLMGLHQAKAEGKHFDKAVLVSMDRKLDWSREGTAHPILAAEVRALYEVPFEMWTIEKLAEEIGRGT
nr:hypothetical protein RTCK_01501 [Rhizobium sp. TCK]